MMDRFETRLWVVNLTAAEQLLRSNLTPAYAVEFIEDMRERWDSRNQDVQYGAKPWEPTVKQMNYLESIVDKFK